MAERIQKLLSQWGIASRRQAEAMIQAGRVRLNGQIVTLGQKADLNCDRLEVDGQLLLMNERPELIYILLNKPIGVVCTCHDPQHRPTVLDLLPSNLSQGKGIHPVGRLDTDSTGALFLTNDGDLTLQLTHPRYHLSKRYRVWVKGSWNEHLLTRWRKGIMLAGKRTLPAQVNVLQRRGDLIQLEIVIVEGRNRQIRRVAEILGLSVTRLHRIAIGPITLDERLGKGEHRFLTNSEIDRLKRSTSTASENTIESG